MEPTTVEKANNLGFENNEDNGINGEAEKSDAKFGSGPSGPIPDGGGGSAKQAKESTGKDSNMGGAGGGTTGMGKSKEKSSMDTEE